ncbi:MAG: hypothetical protein ABIH47_08660 [Candidatus Omnitrophota bacterium]
MRRIIIVSLIAIVLAGCACPMKWCPISKSKKGSDTSQCASAKTK